MHIEPFAVEEWMNAYENDCQWNLAETCVASLTVGGLLKLTGQTEYFQQQVLDLHLTYGAIEGSSRLRAAIAALYDSVDAEQVVVTHGAIGANHLAYLALIEAGDEVVSVVPSYQQHYSIPESLGATVHRVPLYAERGWLPDEDELLAAIGPKTKLVTFTNPNNPTGSVLGNDLLTRVVAKAQSVGAYILADEVYRGIGGTQPSIADLYDRGIAVGSMSKAFSLAGLRLGWLVAPPEVRAAVTIHRDYTTISVGMVDDLLAAIALEHAPLILDRSTRIAATNQQILSDWVETQPALTYNQPRPVSGTTAFIGYDPQQLGRGRTGSYDLCRDLLTATGVMLTPGGAFGWEHHLRFGYANSTEVLEAGLDQVGQYLTTA